LEVENTRKEDRSNSLTLKRHEMAKRLGCAERVALFQKVPELPFTNELLAKSVGLTVEDFQKLPVSIAACNIVFDALAESRSRAQTAQRGASSMPEVVTNPLLQTLSGDLGRVEARVKQLAARLGPAHPEYQAAQAELDQLRSRLQTEMARVGGSIAAGNDVNLRREAELRGLLEAQRGKVAGVKLARDRLQVLEREVQGSQRALDLVAQRFTETSLESQARQSNVSILTPASVPTMPSRPLPMLNALIGGLLGLFVAVLAALTLESMNRPLRTAEDLSAACGVPVLAVVPQAATRRPQRLIGTSGPGAGLPPTLRLGN
jgi:hypothetical protein